MVIRNSCFSPIPGFRFLNNEIRLCFDCTITRITHSVDGGWHGDITTEHRVWEHGRYLQNYCHCNTGSAPMKRLKEDAKEGKRLVDATQGRRTRSIIITDSNHVILSAIQAETISSRFVTGFEFKDERKKAGKDKK